MKYVVSITTPGGKQFQCYTDDREFAWTLSSLLDNHTDATLVEATGRGGNLPAGVFDRVYDSRADDNIETHG